MGLVQTMRDAVCVYAKQTYETAPEYLWENSPNSAVLRRKDSAKWYAVLMLVARDKLGLRGQDLVDVIVVKCDPLLIGSLLSKQGFLPAYHMNKERWVTMLLDGTVATDEITSLLDLSYQLAGKK